MADTTKPHKYFSDQFDDEEVIHVFRKHPVVMRKGLIFGMLGPLIGVLPAAIDVNLGMNGFFIGLAGGILLGTLVFLPSWIGWHFSIFIVTNQRFLQIKQKGLFTRSVSDINLNQIQSVSYEVVGIQETLLGFGKIIMKTYLGDIEIPNVHHPSKIQKRISVILRDLGISSPNYVPVTVNNASEFNEEQTQEV